ncbi:MAG TPA: GAF domain-containing protein [Chloroflexota bacterium]|nr:GAF domain-containing protein [Chloroflexota bacterium]
MSEHDQARELQDARSQIQAQQERIEALEAELRDARTSVLREIRQISDVMRATVGERPYRRLLEGIVVAAQRLFEAGASSIALLDDSTNELVFEAATGAGAEEVLQLRFPANRGIAGWVMMTGEPLIVSDVRRDPRFSQSFAQSTGYVPNSIMAVPLLIDEEVRGVLEVLDKASAASFGLDDLELLGLFAGPAAVAVQQAQLVTGVGDLLLSELEQAADGRGDDDTASLAGLIRREEGDDRSLALAQLVHRLSRRGERNVQLAEEILTAILRSAR